MHRLVYKRYAKIKTIIIIIHFWLVSTCAWVAPDVGNSNATVPSSSPAATCTGPTTTFVTGDIGTGTITSIWVKNNISNEISAICRFIQTIGVISYDIFVVFLFGARRAPLQAYNNVVHFFGRCTISIILRNPYTGEWRIRCKS